MRLKAPAYVAFAISVAALYFAETLINRCMMLSMFACVFYLLLPSVPPKVCHAKHNSNTTHTHKLTHTHIQTNKLADAYTKTHSHTHTN